ncbi:hypothetical protein [Stagnihabitans tardus]|uniref:Uncharacterized protein n=1 Tax=Stagnihabitans tardus TaxID=2699202 RepID=A0AAE4Y9X9_9RHOB|nr:hypothetical protein [Stagnihabitans tardus]NBZ88696.1 hypothetical protein [Stagnihabitans tardus]
MTLPATLDGPATAARSWRAPSQPTLTRIDLQGLVESGALTGLHMQSDGSLLLDCPAALPAELEGLVEEAEPGVEDRLARMEQKLSTLTLELQERERMADRLDAVEFGLAERLQGVIADEVLNLFAEQEAGPSVVERVEQLLEATRSPAPTSDLAEVILARLPDPERIEALLQRTPDLSPLRQMNAQFLQGMQHVVTRLEARLTAIEPERLMGQLAALQPKAPDLDPLFARLEACLAPMQATLSQLVDRVSALESRPAPVFDMTENRRSFAAFATALSTSLRRIESLDAKLDQTPALQAEIEKLGAGLTALGDRIDEMRPADLSPIGAALTALTEHVATLTVPPETLAPMERALSTLTERVEALTERLTALERRPAPTLDLTEQRKSFAGFATAIGATLHRIETLADRMEAEARPLSDLAPQIEALVATQPRGEPLADAILALAQRAADRESSASLPGFEAFRAAQQDFFQDLRFLLAEIVATQMRHQALAS